MASAQGGLFFPAPAESRILSQLQSGVAIDQIIKSWVLLFFYCLLFQFIYWEILYSSLRMYFLLLILGSLCMLKIILAILKKVFWTIKGEIILVFLPTKPLDAPVPSLAPTSLFVHSSTPVPTLRKGQPNPSPCKFWFYFITAITVIVKPWTLILTLLHVLRTTVWESSKEVLSSLLFLLFLLVDL